MDILEDEESLQPPSKKVRQAGLLKWTERSFTAPEKERAEKLLARLQVTFGLSFHSLDSDAMRALCKCLRYDFKVPSRRTLQRRVGELYTEMVSHVDKHLASRKVCNGHMFHDA